MRYHEASRVEVMMMTEWQRYIRSRSREAKHLHCSRCGVEPPRLAGGLCDSCRFERKRLEKRSSGNPPGGLAARAR